MTLNIWVNFLEENNIVGRTGSRSEKSKNVTVPYAEIDVIELKKVDGGKTVGASLLGVVGIFGLLIMLNY